VARVDKKRERHEDSVNGKRESGREETGSNIQNREVTREVKRKIL
jgi:hypothetical protein